MRPRIRYCATPAGRVAYCAAGAGPALLLESGWVSHLLMQLELFSFGSVVERLAERFTVIRYDKPGCGLSDRDGTDLSFDGQVATALAVADAVGADRFRMFGASQGGQVAAAIAARYPERVEALVLYGMCASGTDLAPAEVRESVVALVRAHWGLGLKALAGAFVTDPTAEDVAAFTRVQRASASAARAAGMLEVYYDTDIRALLPQVRARTAVLHREADRGTRFELGREVAALIPEATLIPLAMLHPTLPVYTGVYLLPLRHPVLVARQLADIAQLAPGRLIFGTGIGGEDRHEVAICGVDPATRGLRMDECLTVVRQLLTGKAVTFHGTFFDLDEAVISPAPAQPVPIIIGGRSDAAIRRAGRLGDGWLGIWNSPRRFAAAVEMAAEEAARAGRPGPPRRHAMQVWCGFADSKPAARACLAPAMEAFYQLPFERFERYCPYGTAADVAEFLAPYAASGCAEFNLIPQAPDPGHAIASTAAVKRLLASS